MGFGTDENGNVVTDRVTIADAALVQEAKDRNAEVQVAIDAFQAAGAPTDPHIIALKNAVLAIYEHSKCQFKATMEDE